ncbi:MAG: methyltransferase domain-containing protein [Hyphomicrobiales bacterium]
MNTIYNPDKNDALSSEETMALLLAIREKGIMDNALLNQFEATPRRMFLNAGQVQAGLSPTSSAPIACGQVQTAPITIATIIKALGVEPDAKVFEIGTGSGYQSAILARLCGKLYTVDRFRTLVDEAANRFQTLKIVNIISRIGDGEYGWGDDESFDRIIVNAEISSISPELLAQLKVGGIIIAPILQDNGLADIMVHTKTEAGLEAKNIGSARFIPLISGIALSL